MNFYFDILYMNPVYEIVSFLINWTYIPYSEISVISKIYEKMYFYLKGYIRLLTTV